MMVKPEKFASSNNNKNSEGSKPKKLELESEIVSKEPAIYKFIDICKTNAFKRVDQNEPEKLKNLSTKGNGHDKGCSVILPLKIGKIFHRQNDDSQYSRLMNAEVNLQNVATHYQVAAIFSLANVARQTSRLVYSYFATVRKSINFLHLDFSSVEKIMSSNELHVDSELEIMEAAHAWLSHAERNKFAEKLFLKIRVSLLPDEVLNKIVSKSRSMQSISVFMQNKKCVQLVRDVQINKANYKENDRCCGRSKFSILVCGGINTRKSRMVLRVDGENFDDVTLLKDLPKWHYIKAVNVRHQFYLFFNDRSGGPINAKKYDFTLHMWNPVSTIKDSVENYSLNAFMERVYFIGGSRGKIRTSTKSCFYFDTETLKKKSIAKMNEERECAAICTFRGRVVVSGGTQNSVKLRTNEVYCHVSNEWTSMPDMITHRSGHCLVQMASRLYAFGGGSEDCEVYDAFSDKFSVVKIPIADVDFINVRGALTAGEKILIFMDNRSKVAVFDTEREEWIEEKFEVTKDLQNYNCLKIYEI